jgi:uncharacterized membrane protein YciS (DUF1049 family)
MHKAAFFILGFCIGVLVCTLLFYGLGVAFEKLAVRLYESEADQQRNFNIFIVASLISGVVGGVLFSKRFTR